MSRLIFNPIPPKAIQYDNTDSGLEANTISDAIDELSATLNVEQAFIVNREELTTNKQLLKTDARNQNFVCNQTGIVVELPTNPINGTRFLIRNSTTSTQSFNIGSVVMQVGDIYKVLFDGVEWMEL